MERALAATPDATVVSRPKAINELTPLLVVAPEALFASLRGCRLANQLTLIESMATPAAAAVEHRITVLILQSIM